ncbi:MAG TPA: hypothetical protein VG146_01750 [Verrucomicrobiae bacterium]|nr:hypothetical protein [Verrucomicrobiae bacterium]
MLKDYLWFGLAYLATLLLFAAAFGGGCCVGRWSKELEELRKLPPWPGRKEHRAENYTERIG